MGILIGVGVLFALGLLVWTWGRTIQGSRNSAKPERTAVPDVQVDHAAGANSVEGSKALVPDPEAKAEPPTTPSPLPAVEPPSRTEDRPESVRAGTDPKATNPAEGDAEKSGTQRIVQMPRQEVETAHKPSTQTWDDNTDEPGLPDLPIGYDPKAAGLILLREHYPLVEFPLAGSVSKGTRIGRTGSCGIMEKSFQEVLAAHFPGHVLSNHRLEFVGAMRDYEPDMILHVEDRALRIDVEIDEPYSGRTRKPMHYVGSYDDDRDVYFSDHGWVVVRFAEIQVVQEPLACVEFLHGLVRSLLHAEKSSIPDSFAGPAPVSLWTYDQAVDWAKEKYREGYLNVQFDELEEDESVVEAEEDLVRELNANDGSGPEVMLRNSGIGRLTPEQEDLRDRLSELCDIFAHIQFDYLGETRYVEPTHLHQKRARHLLLGVDLIESKEVNYDLRHIQDPKPDEQVIWTTGSPGDLVQLNLDIDEAVQCRMPVRLKYRDKTGQVTIRTITEVEYNFKYGDDHVSGYCSLRKERRTFKLDRMVQYEVLNLGHFR